jgi:hypothetical protein
MITETALSDTEWELWTNDSVSCPDLGEDKTLSTHCLSTIDQNGGEESIYDVFDLTCSYPSSICILFLRAPGSTRFQQSISQGDSYDVSWNFPLTDGSSDLTDSGSGILDLVFSGSEVSYKGYMESNLTGCAIQFYIDGSGEEKPNDTNSTWSWIKRIVGYIAFVGGPTKYVRGAGLAIAIIDDIRVAVGAGTTTIFPNDTIPPVVKEGDEFEVGSGPTYGWVIIPYMAYDDSGFSTSNSSSKSGVTPDSGDGAAGKWTSIEIFLTNGTDFPITTNYTITVTDNSPNKNTTTVNGSAMVPPREPSTPVFPNWYVLAAAVVGAGIAGYFIQHRLRRKEVRS